MDCLQSSRAPARGQTRVGAPRTTAALKGPAELVVFSDDWGRHPSSCQHLVSSLLPRYPVCWVNTIGTRTPRLDRLTAGRTVEKLRAWVRRPRKASLDGNPRVLEPLMWPSFKSRLGRRLNRDSMARSIDGAQGRGPVRIAVTTIPLVADLMGHIAVDRWIYYCVDDLEKWPGLDASSLRRMERQLVDAADTIIAVSEVLVARMAERGRVATLLTHGVDLDHWRTPAAGPVAKFADLESPLIVFWGVVDRRLSFDWLESLSQRLEKGTIALVGPHNEPDPRLHRLAHMMLPGPLPYGELPGLARAADVLVMPYADMPATRAIQPLKLKEYLATGKPVVVSPLPAVAAWSDACDVATGSEDFVERVLRRAASGVPESQVAARGRLEGESWALKAEEFERLLLGGAGG